MAVEDTPPRPPPTPTDKIIPFSSIGLKSHVETDTASTNPEWCQLDDLIKMWIFGSLCDSLQEQVVTTPGNAKALWDHLKNLFHDNKDARAINLDNELRSIKIGKMTVNEYCTKVQAMANRLKNLDCEVSEKNMVIFAVNGLDSCFATLAEIIRHREPLPTFETVRNMLLLKESSFNDDSSSNNGFEGSSSSPTVLLASTSSNTKGNTDKPSTLPQICNHFNRGTCKFGDRCKFIHDHRNRAGLSSQRATTRNTVFSHAGIWNNSSANSYVRPAPSTTQLLPIHYHSGPTVFTTPSAYVMAHSPHSYPTQPPNVVQYQPQPCKLNNRSLLVTRPLPIRPNNNLCIVDNMV
ncbi:hybrid signal transduction histidine kinase M [Tanacetum coccineum]